MKSSFVLDSTKMIDRNVHIQNYNSTAKIRYMHIYPKVNLGRIYVLHSLSIE